MKTLLMVAFSMLISMISFAQETSATSTEVPMMQDHGKLYVVVSVILVIFLGLIGYLVHLERKLNHVEKKVKDKK